MKLALDPYMFRTRPIAEVARIARNLSYDAIELTPRADLLPYYARPRVDAARIAEVRSALDGEGLELASVMALYDWASPDEEQRRAAVRYWLRAIEVVAELGCSVVNTELAGDPERARASEAAFWRSLEELLPRFADAGLEVHVEPHPNDFVEDNATAVDMIRGVESPNLRYLYCAPHTFHLGDDIGAMVRYAAPVLAHVHLADSFDHRAGCGTRYIRNPASSTVRIHQHNVIGVGEVDFDALFAALAETGFDGILTTCVLGWDDRALETSREMRQRLDELLAQHGLADRITTNARRQEQR